MTTDYFKCPQCGTKSTVKKIVNNNYACLNPKCELNGRLLVHGEVTTAGKVSKLYGWVLEPGTVLKKKYEIVKMIGKGGFGATYLAHDQSMFNQLRAIKEIPRSYCDDKEDEFLTFLSHPSIPKLFERFNLKKFHYSVMEYIEGESLEEEVKKRSGGLPEAKVLDYAEQICDVFSYIHSKKVVHRDLKPENILIRKDGTIALIDFGIAKKYIIGQGTRHLARAASYYYSSPEQYRAGKGNTDFKSDIYSFGAILYFISTGIEPIDALSRDGTKDISPLPRSINPRISPKLESVIIKAMKMQKGDRFKSIREMQQVLSLNGKTTSKKVCPKCKALFEPGNNFCPNCGSSTKPIKRTVTSTFMFRSRKKVNTIQQMVQVCYQEWNDARWHLYHGDFEKWLNSIHNGKSLAKKAASIRKNQSDQHLGLNEFLLSSGHGNPPKINVKHTKLKLGKIVKGYTKNIVLSFTNKGHGYLKGTVNSRAKWINLKGNSFSCLSQKTTHLALSIDTRKLAANKNYQASININSNGGNVAIPVSISVTADYTRSKTKTRSIIIDVPKGKSVIKEFSITNGTLTGKSKNKFTSLTNWIQVKTKNLHKDKQKLVIIISTKNLNIGKYRGKILIESNKSTQYIDIILNVTDSISIKNNYLIKPILLFMLVALVIRYLGPTAHITISKPWIIILMGLIFGIMNTPYGKVGIILGLFMGSSLGALMNIISYFVFPFINGNIVIPSMKLLSMAYSNKMNYASWGLLGAYIGGIFVICMRKSIKRK